MKRYLISVEDLHKKLNHEDLIILDSSPQSNKAGKQTQYPGIKIPHARTFDLKGRFSDQSNPLPNMLPSAAQFEEECRKLGINQESEIVVYDNLGIYTSPRVWWLFKIMGHEKISVLNGGLVAWKNAGYETTAIEASTETWSEGDFQANLDRRGVKKYKEIVNNLTTKEHLLIDVRSAGRFSGQEAEPRKYLQSGHIPHSINIPYQSVLEDGKYKSKEELKGLFENKQIGDEKLIFSCGSGLTACIVFLASEMVMENEKSLYDGSWTEWAERQNLKNDRA